MKAVQIKKNGGVEVLEYVDVPVPTPGENQVLIKNEIIGINYIDTYFRSGLYPAPKLPLTLGREAAGKIVAVGSGNIPSSLKEGVRAVYLGQEAYAEYTAAPVLHTYALPDGVSDEIAAATLLQGLTAITLIRDAHYVKKGEWVLVHAAAGTSKNFPSYPHTLD